MKLFSPSFAVIVVVLGALGVQAQEVAKFSLKRGQVLQYNVRQTSKVIDSLKQEKSELTSQVQQVKQWQVTDVAADGSATLQLSLARMVMQQVLPTGETWSFDSANPEQGHAQLREQLSPFIGKALAVVRIDAIGRVLEVKNVFQGSPSRYESELPFTIVLSGAAMQTGQGWVRDYRIVLDPPLGTGEKYTAQQRYQIQQLADGKARISFATTIKTLPENPTDRLPLMQLQPQGEAVFDTRLGLVTSARFVSTGVVEGHQGEGSRYEYRSEYNEDLVIPK